MVVTVVDVGEVLVLVGDRHVPMLGSGEDGDHVRTMVSVSSIDRVGVLDDVVSVAMAVTARGDDEHTNE